MKTVLVTGSAGLVGSESVKFFCERDFNVLGIDNNMRAYFFGKEARILVLHEVGRYQNRPFPFVETSRDEVLDGN